MLTAKHLQTILVLLRERVQIQGSESEGFVDLLNRIKSEINLKSSMGDITGNSGAAQIPHEAPTEGEANVN